MLQSILRSVRGYDPLLFLSTLVLILFGFAALYSIGLGKEPSDFFYLQKQLLICIIFLVLSLFVSLINYHVLKGASWFLYIGSCLFLLAVLFFGETIRGTRGWFSVGEFALQPAEFAKLGLIFMLAWYLARFGRHLHLFRHVCMTALITIVPVMFIVFQPDMGSASVLLAVWFGMLLLSGIPRRFIALIILAACITAVSAWFFVLKDYQKSRVMTFFQPSVDSQGAGYNLTQASIAIGAGELFGRGLGLGSQSHLKFLPEAQTDFVFSVIAEEMGFIGVGIFFLFWLLFFYRLTAIMRAVREDFATSVVGGVCILFFVQLVFNIGGNLGLVPLTGLVLPFISYGGSALAVSLLLLGIVQSAKAYNS